MNVGSHTQKDLWGDQQNDGQLAIKSCRPKLPTRGNRSYKVEGVRGGQHPAVDINRLNKKKKLCQKSVVLV